jgi:hypothetical protein
MERLVVLAALLLATPAAHAVDVVLGGKPVAPPAKAAAAPAPGTSCASRGALESGTRLGAPAAPSLSMTRVYTEVRSPARGRVQSLAYPRIKSQDTTERYAYTAGGAGTVATASGCAWTGRPAD